MNNLLFFGFVFIALFVFYFFLTTKASLILQKIFGDSSDPKNDIYWIYKNSFLIWLTDRQFIPSAILFFNYKKMVDEIIHKINSSGLKNKELLQMACVFGNCSQRLIDECEFLERMQVLDLMQTEIENLRKKTRVSRNLGKCLFFIADASDTKLISSSQDFIIIFFLFHELPKTKKRLVLKEASRLLKPKGKIIFGEFHKPKNSFLRLLGKCYFNVFEPYAKEMWSFDPVEILEDETGQRWTKETTTYSRGNYQVTELSMVDCSKK